MSKVATLKNLSEWQTALASYNKQDLTEPLFITTDLDYRDADVLLEANEHNRTLLLRIVKRYEQFMRKGEWLLNGECIKVAKDGTLLDGQHRLAAIKQYGEPVRVSMALGVDPKTFAVNDTGKSRNAGDILAIAGYKNVTQNAAAFRYFLWYQQTESFSGYPDITPHDILTAIQKYPHMPHFVNPSHPHRILGPQSVFQFFMYVTQTIDPELSYDFFYKLETGEKLGKTSAILMFRRAMMQLRVSNLSIDKRHLLASVIITWNSYVEKTRLKTIKWDGKAFPMITGVDRGELFKAGSGFGQTND